MRVIGKEPSGEWLKVKAPDGRIGWMFPGFLQVNIALSGIPAVAIPFPPTPTTGRVYGPLDGKLNHEENNTYEFQAAGVDLLNFMADVKFYNPYDRSEHSWDYGLSFRDTGYGKEYRLYIDSDANWFLLFATVQNGKADFDWVESGKVKNLHLSPNSSNSLRLVVKDETAFFYVNGVHIATLDVSKKNTPGDVQVAIGLGGHEFYGKSTRYEGFTVWSLP